MEPTIGPHRHLAIIRRNADGAVAVTEHDDIDPRYGTVFWWTEGNFGCDCNRHLAFEYAFGNEIEDDEEFQCGHEKYTLVELWLYGELVVRDDEIL
jgi:hypothetical protein